MVFLNFILGFYLHNILGNQFFLVHISHIYPLQNLVCIYIFHLHHICCLHFHQDHICTLKNGSMYCKEYKLGQVSRMTGILEVERSLDSCTLAVHRPLAYFRSANLKTFCKYAKSIIKDVNCFVKKMGKCEHRLLQSIAFQPCFYH